jgi:hypothetical protein
MATVGYAQRLRAREAAAKQRRKKVLAIASSCVLVALLAIQVPRTLKLLRPDKTTRAAAATRPSPRPRSTAPTPSRRAFKFLRGPSGSDPFARRALPDADTPALQAAAPAGAHDPFTQPPPAAPAQTEQPAARPAPPAAPAPTEQPPARPIPVKVTPKPIVAATPRRPDRHPRSVAYIVVLASIPLTAGRSEAFAFAIRAGRRGAHSVGIVNSSTHDPLRPGYYAVYSGLFATQPAAQRAATRMHRLGYTTAYVRRFFQ